jgi:two-component system, chemotaxis family, chemotaxis protein CheY
VTSGMRHRSALVVDDLEVMRRSVANLLRKQGFSPVDEVSSVAEALDAAAEIGGYDLILSDWNMDPKTGLDLLISVRSEVKYENTVFVLMTAEPTDEKRAAAEAAGVSGFMVKPFGASTLVSEVTEHFGME